MSTVVRMSEAASLGLHAMALLAKEPGCVCSTREIAGTLNVSEAHLAKVMQRLARSGYASSVRGRRGGFALAGDGDPTLLELYEAIEGALEQPGCLLGIPVCDGEVCILGGLLEDTGRRVRDYLAETRLSGLARVYAGGKDAG